MTPSCRCYLALQLTLIVYFRNVGEWIPSYLFAFVWGRKLPQVCGKVLVAVNLFCDRPGFTECTSMPLLFVSVQRLIHFEDDGRAVRASGGQESVPVVPTLGAGGVNGRSCRALS